MEKTCEKNGLKKSVKVLICITIAVIAVALFWILANAVTCGLNTSYAASFEPVGNELTQVPAVTDDGYSITTDEELNILHLTDVHIGGGFLSYSKDKKALATVAKLVDDSKPDLVIITGDLTFAVMKSGSFNNERPARELATLMESLGVYWTLIPGNHDVEIYDFSGYDEWAQIYEDEQYKHCLFARGPETVDGYGNHVIDIKNSEGEITQSLIMMDSNSYPEDNKIKNELAGIYDNIHENQLQWYREMISKRSTQDKTVSSLLFFHIPLEEFNTAWQEYRQAGNSDTENVKYFFGTCGETNEEVCSPSQPDDVFETVLEVGSTKGIFCGHDHLNNFSLEYKGVRLTYGMSIDYLAYAGISKMTEQRGGEIITLYPDSQFTVKQLPYTD